MQNVQYEMLLSAAVRLLDGVIGCTSRLSEDNGQRRRRRWCISGQRAIHMVWCCVSGGGSRGALQKAPPRAEGVKRARSTGGELARARFFPPVSYAGIFAWRLHDSSSGQAHARVYICVCVCFVGNLWMAR